MDRISVVVAAYQRPDFLMGLCNAVRGQEGIEIEIIVCDDGSLPPSFPQDLLNVYVWFKHDVYHKVRNLNAGIMLATSDNIIIMDDDCVPTSKRWAVEHMRVLKSFQVSRGPFEIYSLDDNLKVVGRIPQRFGLVGSYFSAINVGFRKTDLMAIGCFDKDYDGKYGEEDLDLGMRIKRHGLSVGYAGEEALVGHFGKVYSGKRGDNVPLFIKKWGVDPAKVMFD